MRSLIAAAVAAVAAFTAAAPLPALACHRFHVWNYPWPQRCTVSSQTIHAIRVIPDPPDPSAPPKPPPRAAVTPPPLPSDNELRAQAIEKLKEQLRKEATK